MKKTILTLLIVLAALISAASYHGAFNRMPIVKRVFGPYTLITPDINVIAITPDKVPHEIKLPAISPTEGLVVEFQLHAFPFGETPSILLGRYKAVKAIHEYARTKLIRIQPILEIRDSTQGKIFYFMATSTDSENMKKLLEQN
jgi:hypothetical protein